VSLLDDGRDVILVYPEVEVDNGYGGTERVAGPTPTVITGRLQPVVTNDAVATGQIVNTAYRFITRSFPAGAWARITTPGGRPWDVIGEPLRRNGSDMTKHVTVLLRARAPESL